MRFKLDENLGSRGQAILRSAGFDVATVAYESLQGADDHALIDIAHAESRCLVTLDMHFANPLSYPPRLYSGIAVLRLPPKPSHEDLLSLIRVLAQGVLQEQIDGKLWIVERNRFRIYQEPS